MDGDLRDVRTSPESPAQWPDELSNPTFRCCSLQLTHLIIISPGTGLIARSTHLFNQTADARRQTPDDNARRQTPACDLLEKAAGTPRFDHGVWRPPSGL